MFIDFPFESWELWPSGENEATIKLTSNCKKSIEIKIGDGWCKLAQNKDSELKEFETKKYPPVQFLQSLAASGINLIADERVEKYLVDFTSVKVFHSSHVVK